MPDKGRKVDKVDKGGGSSGAHCWVVFHQVDDALDQVESPVTKFDPVSLIHTPPKTCLFNQPLSRTIKQCCYILIEADLNEGRLQDCDGGRKVIRTEDRSMCQMVTIEEEHCT